MSDMSTGHHRDPGWYEFRLGDHLESRWAAWFDGMTLTHQSDGTTNIRGPVVDQAALRGLLRRVCDLGLPLLAVTQVHPTRPPCPRSTPAS